MALNWNLQIKVDLKCEEISQQECCKTVLYCCLAEWRGNGLEVPEAQSFRSTESEWQSNVKNARRASGTVPNVYLCSCKQQNSPLESVVWTQRKLSDLIIGQTHLLPVKTISCSSRSAQAPVQISEAANRFLPAASVGFLTSSVEPSRGSEDPGNATDRPGVKPAIWSPRRRRCAQQSITVFSGL